MAARTEQPKPLRKRAARRGLHGSASSDRRAAGGRVARRRERTRDQIVAQAAHHFANRGLDGVRLDQIAEGADVARGTLYSHFPTKGALVSAVIRPALELAVHGVAGLEGSEPRAAVEGIVALYLRLWARHADALRVSHRLVRMPSREIERLHHDFVAGLGRALAPAAAEGILRVRSPDLAVRVIARVAVPLLELYDGASDLDRLFGDSLGGLLIADCGP